ncbi:MAG: hypothetical protein IJ630_10760 [Treponema sp.]|nr:hypothetical protein [Treponema sp.]
MKKILTTVLISIFTSLAVFGADYSVKAVTGKVQYEASAGNWKNVSVGQILSDSTLINTSLNSSLVITGSAGDVTIKAMQKGSVKDLSSAPAKVGGLKKTLNRNSIAGNASAASKGTATASSRASEAKADFDWEE